MTEQLISPADFIKNVLCVPRRMGMGSPAAEKLLFMIAAHESGRFRHRKQVGGPALSLFQIEPDTFVDVWARYLHDIRPEKRRLVAQFLPDDEAPMGALETNDRFACAIARMKLWMTPAQLPDVKDDIALAKYAKKYWNTSAGKATAGKYLADYIACAPTPKPEGW